MNNIAWLAIKGFTDAPIRVRIGNDISELCEILDKETPESILSATFKIHGIGYLKIENVTIGEDEGGNYAEIVFICNFLDVIDRSVLV